MEPPRAPRGEKRVYFGTKILPSTQAAIAALALEENRSMSNMAEEVMLRWLKEHRPDLLPPPDVTPGS